MARRINTSDLDSITHKLNVAAGTPTEPYANATAEQLKVNPTSKYVPQKGCYFLDWAYGGVRLVQMEEGSSESEVLGTGYVPKRECYEAIAAYITGRYADQPADGLKRVDLTAKELGALTFIVGQHIHSMHEMARSVNMSTDKEALDFYSKLHGKLGGV